ncbi:hypothetical protein DMUE_5089 [Dictyocoela muelleri]|nr:hypothetical protein DMUE_5089 [Dictyocoela muelleri]
MYGASIVAEANERQSAVIKKSPNFNGNKKEIFDNIFKRFNENKINCFLFDVNENKIKTINKKFENVADLLKMKIEGNILLSDTNFKSINKNNEIKDLLVKLNYNQLGPNDLIQEISWSGSFYKMTGGYSLSNTIYEFFKHLQSLKTKLGKGIVGAAILGDKVHVFFYNNIDKRVEDIYDIQGMDDKVTALDIFRCFLIVEAKENGK